MRHERIEQPNVLNRSTIHMHMLPESFRKTLDRCLSSEEFALMQPDAGEYLVAQMESGWNSFVQERCSPQDLHDIQNAIANIPWLIRRIVVELYMNKMNIKDDLCNMGIIRLYGLTYDRAVHGTDPIEILYADGTLVQAKNQLPPPV